MPTLRHTALFLIVFCAGSLPVSAQAPKMLALGETQFENSGAAAAQDAFLRGILLLHSFEYEDAREAFADARTIDPDFAMAYWGEAMTHNHPLWFFQKTEASRDILKKLGETLQERLAKAPTQREKDYLHAADVLFFSDGDKKSRDDAYAEFMKGLYKTYPEDLDAAAFYALAILGSSHEGRNYRLYMKAAGIVEDVFANNPQHPGAAHYLIHAYDDPIHAPVGLRAARAYATIAPAASHALHMPSHIFVAMGMWDEVISSNEASWEAADARVNRRSLGPDQRNFHALWWVCYGYLQAGRFEDAQTTMEIIEESVEQTNGSPYTRRTLIGMRAAYVVETQEWTTGFADIKVDHEGLSEEAQAQDLFTLGLLALKHGNEESARQHLSMMLTLLADADSSERGVQAATVMQHALKALLLLEEGNQDEALALLRKAADMEDAMIYEYGPPSPVKPAHELLGEMLLAAGHATEAQTAFSRALERAPRRSLSLLGLAHAATAAGDNIAAQKARTTLANTWDQADKSVTALLESLTTMDADM